MAVVRLPQKMISRQRLPPLKKQKGARARVVGMLEKGMICHTAVPTAVVARVRQIIPEMSICFAPEYLLIQADSAYVKIPLALRTLRVAAPHEMSCPFPQLSWMACRQA